MRATPFTNTIALWEAIGYWQFQFNAIPIGAFDHLDLRISCLHQGFQEATLAPASLALLSRRKCHLLAGRAPDPDARIRDPASASLGVRRRLVFAGQSPAARAAQIYRLVQFSALALVCLLNLAPGKFLAGSRLPGSRTNERNPINNDAKTRGNYSQGYELQRHGDRIKEHKCKRQNRSGQRAKQLASPARAAARFSFIGNGLEWRRID